MTSNINNLTQAIPFERSDNIKVGNDQGLPIQHIGSATLKTHSRILKLSNILRVPQITEDLLSVKQLCKDNKCWFICDDVWFYVQDKVTKEIIYKGKSRPHELFQIPVVKLMHFPSQSFVNFAYLGQRIKSSLWH